MDVKTIFVFGSNTEGLHGAGAARYAFEKFGAIDGVPFGIQGNAFAIVTKDLKLGRRSIPLSEIEIGIKKFNEFATSSKRMAFIVSPIGTGLAGYTIEEIKPLFKKFTWPNFVYFHSAFL